MEGERGRRVRQKGERGIRREERKGEIREVEGRK